MIYLLLLVVAGTPMNCVAAPSEHDPTNSREFKTVRHPVYPISIRIPRRWQDNVGRDNIIPVDTWSFSWPEYFATLNKGAAAYNESEKIKELPTIYFLVSWLPRVGRHSAGFPGGRLEDEHGSKLLVGKKDLAGILENKDTQFLADWDEYGLALSLKVRVPNKGDWPLIKEVLRSFSVDESQAAPKTIEQAGLEQVEQFAREKKINDFNVVYTPSGSDTGPLLYTIFLRGIGSSSTAGLVTVEIDRNSHALRVTFPEGGLGE